MTEEWPWRGEGLKPDQLVIWNRTHKSRENQPEGWVLSNEVKGQVCITRGGPSFTKFVGHNACKLIHATNST